MANKNLFLKDATVVKATKKADKTKKDDKAKAEEKTEAIPDSQPQEEQEETKAKPSKKKVKVNGTRKAKKPSMVDAALKVLGEAKEPMNCKDLVDAMTTKGLWSSPSGKTPPNTLYSAFLRLIQAKGKGAAVRKADKGTFEINPSATA